MWGWFADLDIRIHKLRIKIKFKKKLLKLIWLVKGLESKRINVKIRINKNWLIINKSK